MWKNPRRRRRRPSCTVDKVRCDHPKAGREEAKRRVVHLPYFNYSHMIGLIAIQSISCHNVNLISFQSQQYYPTWPNNITPPPYIHHYFIHHQLTTSSIFSFPIYLASILYLFLDYNSLPTFPFYYLLPLYFEMTMAVFFDQSKYFEYSSKVGTVHCLFVHDSFVVLEIWVVYVVFNFVIRIIKISQTR